VADPPPRAPQVRGDRLEITGRDGPGAVLAVTGELDAYTGPVLSEALAAGGDVTLDLSGVSFVDSSALRILVQAQQERAAQGARLQLQAPSDVVRRLLDVSGLSELFAIPDGG
jgi:stage II sporulation protein AA (anti-sigma F factor antagonist)